MRRKCQQTDTMPLFPEAFLVDPKIAVVLGQRGQIVSAFMKNLRLGREADAMYWFTALFRSGVDRGYLSRRCFGSAAEDSLSLQALEMGCDLARRPERHSEWPLYQSIVASARGLKWYSPIGAGYIIALSEVWQGPREFRTASEAEVLAIASDALGSRNVFALAKCHRELAERRRGGFELLDLLLAAASRRESPIQRLAAVCTQLKWLVVTREINPVLQLVWTLCRGPFPGCEAPVSLDGLDRLHREVEARWAAPELEPIPAWCLDGLHTSGTDRRFAGDWPGCRNMCAMFAAYGRLDPADPGILIP